MTSAGRTRNRRSWLAGLALGVLVVLAAADRPPVEVWWHAHDSGAGNDYGYAVAIDSQGDVLTAGYAAEDLTNAPGTGMNGFLQKRGYDGVIDWTVTLDNTATDHLGSGDQFHDVCVDGDDNVIVGGIWSGDWGAGAGYWQSGIVQKYDADGTLLWEWFAGGGYGAWSTIHAVQIDDAGNVYAAGSTYTNLSVEQQWAIFKLSPDGDLQPGYPKYHDQSSDHRIADQPFDIDVRGDGSFVVAGVVGVALGDITNTRDWDWHVRAYHLNGDLAWSDTFSGAAGFDDRAYGVSLDDQGHAYVAGYTNVGTNNTDGRDYDGLLIKYSPTGTRLWTTQNPGDPGDDVFYRDVAFVDDGVLATAGYTLYDSDTYDTAFTEGRDPANGDLLGDDTLSATDGHAQAFSTCARGRLLAYAGHLGPVDDLDLYTALTEFPNTAPVIDEPPSTATRIGAIGENVPFSIAAHDPDEDPITIAWDFGDGSFANGPNPMHSFANPGHHGVTVTVSDGIDDVVEMLDFHVGIPVEKPSVKAKLNFKKADKDTLTFKCGLDLTPQLLIEGQQLTVDVGGVEETFTLDRKGKAKTDAGKVTLKFKKKKRLWLLTMKLKKGDFAGDWQDEGLVDETQKKAPGKVKIIVELGADIDCAHVVDVLYTAKAGKWGKTK